MLTRAVRLFLVLLGVSLALQAGEITLSGVVIDHRQKPIAGASIKIEWPHSDFEEARAQIEELKPRLVAATISDARGQFRIAVPRPGLWRVVFRARGFAPERRAFVPLPRSIELPPVLLRPVVPPSIPPSRIKVISDSGTPVAGARLHIVPPIGEFPPAGPERPTFPFVRTGPDGRASVPFELTDSRIAVVADGYLEAQFINLNKDGMIVHLVRGCRRTFDVVDARNRPAAGVVVQTGLWTRGIGDAAGRVEITAPCDAETSLRLLARDGRQAREVLRPARNGELPKVRFKLPPPAASARLRGRALAADSRKPLAGVLVWTDDAPAGFTLSDAQGWFSVREPARKGSRLEATADGVVFAHDDLVALGPRRVLADGSLEGPTFHLQPAAMVSGTATDEAGRPVKGVGVQVASTWPPNSEISAMSDGSGAFRLRFPAKSELRLVVSHEDFLAASLSLDPLAAGEQRRVAIVLKRARVATALIVDSNGRPVTGAKGFLSPPEGCLYYYNMEPDPQPCRRESTSDLQGRLRFMTLPPGKYHLAVRALGFAPLSVPSVEVHESREVTSFGTMRLSPGSVIAGRVVDLQDRPVQGVSVLTANHETEFECFASQAETGADGRFAMADFSPGSRLRLFVFKEGYAEQSSVGRLSIGVEASTEKPVTIRLESYSTHRVSCAIRDENGEPIATARVGFISQELKKMIMNRDIIPVQVDEEGRCEFLTGEPGIATLQVTANGYLPREVDFEVPAGGDLEPLEIMLRTAPAVLVGQITGPGGEPIADCSPDISPRERAEKGPSPGPAWTSGTDSNGRFRMEGLTEGRWVFNLAEPGYRRERRELEIHAGENQLVLQLRRGTKVEGQVVDSAGRPVPYANLSLAPKRPSQQGDENLGSSDETGHFLIDGVEPGLYTLQAQAEGFLASDSMEVSLTGPAVSGLRIVLKRK